MWCQARYIMRKRGYDIVSGPQKAILELSAAMRSELDFDDVDIPRLEEVQIKQRILAAKGGRISYDTQDPIENQSTGTVLWLWLIREKWWISMSTLSLLITTTTWLAPYGTFISIWVSGLSCGLLVALSIGSSRKSRVFCVSFFCTLSSVAVIILLIVIHPWSKDRLHYSNAATRLLYPV